MSFVQHAITISILFVFVVVEAHAAQFARVIDKQPAGLAEIVTKTAGVEVVFVGEIHDDNQHHKALFELLHGLQARKLAVAIGLEMFTTEDQQQLDDWIGGKLDEASFKLIYARNWSYGWSLYRDLFMFARDQQIPLIALNIPKSVMTKVVAQGPAALQSDEVPPKISWSLNEAQSNYMKTIARQVFGTAAPEKFVARLCEAQALRNHGMAWNIAKYKQKHEADKVVVLAGMWHAVKNGIPDQLSAYGNLSYLVVLPELPEFSLQNATDKEADYLLLP